MVSQSTIEDKPLSMHALRAEAPVEVPLVHLRPVDDAEQPKRPVLTQQSPEPILDVGRVADLDSADPGPLHEVDHAPMVRPIAARGKRQRR